jgi:TonB-linked SusC/RagA family outer membrane protein
MRKLVLLFLAVLATGSLFAQNRQVTGTVTDESGAPVVGTMVHLQGTQTAVMADATGRYSINAPTDGSLEFSFSGMTSQTIAIGSQSVINVVLQTDAQLIETVVVLGLGVTRTERSTGFATQKIDANELNKTNNTSLAGSLQGKLSGVSITPSSGMPGASSMMVIRGARSFTGTNIPLYVVDGMPINSDADFSTGGTTAAGGTDIANRGVDIDPNDIESVQILKGQAAAALYGMRASNGVVMLTTKSGRGGEKGRTNVTFNTSVTLSQVSRLPDFQNEYAQGSYGSFDPTSSMSWGPKISELANDPAFGYGGSGPTSPAHRNLFQSYWDQWQSSASPGEYFVPQRAFAGMDPWTTPTAYENNAKDFFSTGVITNNSVNISKNTDQSTISFTLSNAYETGIIPSTGMERYNAKLFAETKLNSAWTLGFSGNYVNSRINKATGANDGVMATVYPTPPSYDLGGIPAYYENTPWKQNTYRATSGFDAAYWYVDNNEFRENTSRFFGNSYLMFKPDLAADEHNLNFRLQLGTDTYATKYHDVWGYGHQRSATTSGADVPVSGSVTNRVMDVTNFNGLFTVNYDWTINDRWRLDASAGTEFIHENQRDVYSSGDNFNFPNWNHINNATIYNASEGIGRFRSVGFFGTATLTYANQLFLMATGRNDIISSMPRDNRSFVYPSLSLSWNFTELESLRNNILTYGKVRVSFAQVGQKGDYFKPYYETPVFGGGFYSYDPFFWPHNGITAFAPSASLYDPNLRPQNTNSIETGFDLYFWNGVLGLSYTYSYQDATDQIFNIPYAASTGITEVIQNGGRITTDTHEATLSINPRFGGDFSWSTDINFTKMDNRVRELATGVESIFLGGFVTPQVRGSVGDPFPSIYGVSYMRDEDGNMVLDSYGLPIGGAPAILGSVQPKFILGANTTFGWKNLSVSAVIDWKNGGQMLAATGGILDYYGVTEESRRARENGISYTGVYEDGSPANITHTTADEVQDYYSARDLIDESAVFDSSFIKLRELSLNYNFKAGKNLNMGVNVFARNLLLWTAIPNIDPESSQGNDNMAGAFERFSLPQTSNYGMGLTFNF